MLTQSQYDLLCPFATGPIRFEYGLPEQFIILEHHGYIVPSAFGSSKGQYCFPVEWSITPLGLELKERFEYQREERAAEAREKEEDRAQKVVDSEKQRRHNWLVALVSACCGSIITLIVEHFDEILVIWGHLL